MRILPYCSTVEYFARCTTWGKSWEHFKSLRTSQQSLGIYLIPGRKLFTRPSNRFSYSSLSPALIARARNIVSEHDKLSKEISRTFDNKTARRLGELKRVTEAFNQWEAHEDSLVELNGLLTDPTTDNELYKLVTDDIVETKSKIQVVSRNLALALTPVHPFEKFPCLLEIRPGAGGSEAAIFATDLLRMYTAYCARTGLHSSILKYETADGPESPLTEAVIEVDTEGAYGKLRTEAGVHRVQRVPATESKGRVHTSAVGVLVLPSLPTSSKDNQSLLETDFNDPSSDYYVNPKDVRTDVMRARGAGGQHVNTTDSAVRLTHIPTNTVVAIQDSRSQHANRAKAWQLLRSKLAQAKRDAREEEIIKLRRGVIGVAKMGRGDKVRTYNWGQQRVSDHRSGFHSYNLDDVINGGLELDKIIESVRTWQLENEMEAMLQEEKTPTRTKK